jgi:uncharacterized protein
MVPMKSGSFADVDRLKGGSQEPTMTVLEIPDDQAVRLRARAEAQGLTLEEWLKNLADEPAPNRLVTIFEKHFRGLSDEDLTWMPPDGASEHDHYIYWLPKRNR